MQCHASCDDRSIAGCVAAPASNLSIIITVPARIALEPSERVPTSAPENLNRTSPDALRESQARLNAALAVAELGTFEWIIGPNTVVFDARSREIFGFAPDEDTSGEQILSRLHPDDALRVESDVQAALKNNARVETQYRIVLPNGTQRTILSSTEAIAGADGKADRVVGVFRDITESATAADILRQIQAKTERQERFYDTILSTSPDLMYVFDLNHRFSYVNEALLKMWGKTWDESIGKTCLELGYEPWHAEMHNREIDTIAATKQPIRGEVPFNGTHGRRIYDYILVPIIGADGEVEAVAGTTRDVTERKSAEINASFLADVSHDLARVPTPHEIVRMVGERLHGLLGISMCAFIQINEQADTATIQYDWHQDDVPSLAGTYLLPDFVSEEFLDVAKAGQPIILRDIGTDARVVEKQKWSALKIGAHLLIPLIRGGEWCFGLGVFHRDAYHYSDFEIELMQELAARIWTRLERAFAEQEREALLEREQAARHQAEEASRLKDQFLATVSHELRTPLNSILGWSHILKSGSHEPEFVARAIETISRNAKSQSQLIEDILDVSRIITGKLRIDIRPVTLKPIVDAVIDSLRPAIDAKGIHVELALDDQSRPLLADPDRIQQVVWNLVSNAIKFTPEQGRVEIAIECDASETRIVVADTGIGMRPEFLPYVFDRFRQADGSSSRTHSGLGLGLSIVRHIMELHGGTVEVDSAGEGQGSTFTVRLPYSTTALPTGGETVPAKAEAPAGTTPRPGSMITGLRILVLDDETDTRDMLVTILASHGAAVTARSTVSEALQAVGEWEPDLVISDIAMPHEDGYDFIQQLRALPASHGGSVPAIAVTACVGEKERQAVLASGFQLYLAKPVEPVELLAALASLT